MKNDQHIKHESKTINFFKYFLALFITVLDPTDLSNKNSIKNPYYKQKFMEKNNF